MHRRTAAAALAAATLLPLGVQVALPPTASAGTDSTFRNPLGTAPDPFVFYADGSYYLAESDPQTGVNGIVLAKASSLANLATAPRTRIWTGDATSRNQNIWAPSVHRFGDRWYVYFTADDGVDEHHRMYVIESDGTDPLGGYHFKNSLAAPGSEDTFAIDGDVLEQDGGKLYFVWSGAGSEGHNVLYVAPMSNPWTISGPRTYLPADGGCSEVREAPAFLRRGNTNYLVYSTCDTGKPDYQLWMKSIPTSADPTDPNAWRQYGSAVFTRNDDAGVYGPGSANFFPSPDGTQTWIAYHAKNTTTFTYAGRDTRAQQISFAADGTPQLGRPVPKGATQELPSGDPGHGPFWINDDGRSGGGGSGSVTFTGSWNATSGCGVQCFWGDDHGSNEAGATATWTFTGTRIALYSVRDTGNGIAAFSIDGGPEETRDFYAAARQGEQLTYLSPVLAGGTHTLRLRVTGTHSSSSSDSYVSVDRAEVGD